ncbi:hypothetical protein CLV01_3364 [Delftia sp. 60]|uniref:DUF6338 family protein n=1 Tax=Delftia sp. 60 TaxID=2035216 RepID=UPI000C54BF79|nr:DUF6338 family protein [Delftia sp. 60]PIF37857.1 hypothetical protein CLU98_3085 [Burkholderiales bacterium 23]PIF66962.1 hypothetical protein CLV01_3364 [Delftia sp. 60]
MPELSKDVVALLQYLAPGFIVAWLFYGLTNHVKPSQFERVVQALLFTVVVQLVVVLIKKVAHLLGEYWYIGEWTDDSSLAASVLSAAIFGLLMAWLYKSDYLYGFLRYLGFTTRSGFPNEWYAAMATKTCYVILHMKDKTRFLGWPDRWPSDRNGFFYLSQVVKETEEGEQDLSNSEGVLLDASEVSYIEFLKSPEAIYDEVTQFETTSTSEDSNPAWKKQAGERESSASSNTI